MSAFRTYVFFAILVFAAFARAQTSGVSDPQLAPRPSPALPPLPPTVPGQPYQQGNQNMQGEGTNADGTKVEEVRTILQGIFEDYRYEPTGKRDPFLSFTAPKSSEKECGPFEDCDTGALQRFDLDQLKLVGIIWDVKTPKAMFIDPSSKTHIVSEQDKIGRNNGYIAEIREGELVVIEKFYNLGRFTYQTKVLKLDIQYQK